MITQTRSGGFTIIEVMLFLAITGALAVAILVGSSAALGQQRYRDSVNSFKGLVQEQYGQIANVVNSEAEKPNCIRSGNNLIFDAENEQARGTSECLVVGRFLLVDETKVTAYNVIGRPDAAETSSDDTTVLGGYALSVQAPEEHEVSWGARIVKPDSGEGLTAAVLILRSPISGSILTYIEDDSTELDAIIDEDGDNHRPGPMITDENMIEKNFCIDSDGGSGMINRLAVRINARAANQSAIEVPLESEGVCD